jgi:hypothetical protein
VDLSICATEIALHEAHVRVQERVTLFLAGLGIGPRHHAVEVREPDRTIEVGDRARLCVNRIENTRAENVVGAAEHRRAVGYRDRGERPPRRHRRRRLQQCRAERAANRCSPGKCAAELTP